MATHSSRLAWKIPWTGEPGRLESMGLQRIGHDFTFTFHFHALEKEMATHSSVLAWRIPGTDGGAWWAAVSGVAQSRTRLKRLSSSSSSLLIVKLSMTEGPPHSLAPEALPLSMPCRSLVRKRDPLCRN